MQQQFIILNAGVGTAQPGVLSWNNHVLAADYATGRVKGDQWVLTWNGGTPGYTWETVLQRLNRFDLVPKAAVSDAPAAITDPVPAETLKSVLDNCNQNTAELEARIKKLQEKVEFLTENDRLHTETAAAMGLWKTQMQGRVAELEKKAIIAAQLETKTEKGLLLLEGAIGRKSDVQSSDILLLQDRVAKLEKELVALRNPSECQPWCTEKGVHVACSPPTVIGLSAGNPGETARREVVQDWHTEKADCIRCSISVGHTHWNRLPVGIRLKPGPLPCQPGCIYKPPHEGSSCVVLE